MKRLLASLTLVSIALVSRSQTNDLVIQGTTGKFYLEHTVSAKENWYSVGRLYNISPREIAPFNALAISQPLAIGQQLKIPLTASNFSQNNQKSADETLVPVYHILEEKEWLYHLSVTYNKVPIPMLEKWNHVNGSQMKPGMPFIVGYLKVKTQQSALAGGADNKTLAAATTPAAAKEESQPPVSVTLKDEKTTEPAKKTVTPVQETPVANNTTSLSAGNVPEVPAPVYASSHPGGFFSGDFSNSSRSDNGEAATFKSTSGWHDGKYYALMNNVPVGTIVKVTSASTNKSIYAKVLGKLPDMKESAGLAIRISNAAAAELGNSEGKFPVEIKY